MVYYCFSGLVAVLLLMSSTVHFDGFPQIFLPSAVNRFLKTSYFQKYLKKSTPYGQKISLIFIYRKMLLKIFSHLWVIQFWVGPLRERLKWSDKSTSSSLSSVVGFPLTQSTGIQERIVIIKSQSKYVWGMPEGNAIFSMGNALPHIQHTLLLHCAAVSGDQMLEDNMLVIS